MAPYRPAAGVDPAFGAFLIEFYSVTEDQFATDIFTNFWPADGSGESIYEDRVFPGPANILGIKQSLLPPSGNKFWWHLIRDVSVVAETPADKTYLAKIVIQSTYTAGNCSQAYGDASFTILKDDKGTPRVTPHSGSLSVYKLTVSPAESPTDIGCTPV
ncbi:hypothetical protein LZ30DRAFT_593355 [Colletotrichum cereale]|nr:hypothetical protein LZ30DRAFT_593355 [Colletotrichum cereale]